MEGPRDFDPPARPRAHRENRASSAPPVPESDKVIAAQDTDGGFPGDASPRAQPTSMTKKQCVKMHKGISSNARTIENRIGFLKREEEKIWKGLNQVRRHAAKVEEARSRMQEKRLNNESIVGLRSQKIVENKERVMHHRTQASSFKQDLALQRTELRRAAGDQQRQESDEILQRKRLHDAKQRLNKYDNVINRQKEQFESKLRLDQEKRNRIKEIREQQEESRLHAESHVVAGESRLPELEKQEIECLQRLQNSRVLTQAALKELEGMYGAKSTVTALLRSKERSTVAVGLSGDADRSFASSSIGEATQRKSPPSIPEDGPPDSLQTTTKTAQSSHSLREVPERENARAPIC